MSGWFESRENQRGDGDEFVATVCLVAAGVAIALYVFVRVLGGEALGGLAAGVGGGLVLGCVAARLDEPAGHWAGAALLAGLAASGAYALADPATPAPSSYALALWLAAGAALLAASPAILAGERLQLDLWRSRMRAEEKRRLRERMDHDARAWRDRRRRGDGRGQRSAERERPPLRSRRSPYERASWWQSTGERLLVTAAGALGFLWAWVLIDPLFSLLVVVPATIAGRSSRVRAWALRQLSPARARARRYERETEAAAERGECVPLGRSIWYGGLTVLAHRAMDDHVFLAGASGAGKTTTALRLLLGRLRIGRGVGSVDLKGDPETTAGIRSLDPAAQVFDLRDPDGPSFDPLRYGDPVGWASMLAHLTEWSEDHYRLSAQDFLAQLLAALSARSERFDLDQVLGYLAKPGRARELARELRKRGERGERQARGLEAALDRIEDDRSIRSGISGMAARLSTVVYSPNVGHRVGPDSGSGELDLGHALYASGVVHFSLAEPRCGDEAATLAALVAGAVNAAVSTECGAMDLVVDEAHVLGGRRVVGLIRMARSAGVGVLVATQDVFDFAEHTEAIWGSCAVKVCHRQEGRAAQYVADQAGTYTTSKLTEKWEDGGLLRGPVSSGEMSVREVEEYRAHPNLIRELGRGEAVVIARVPESCVDLVAVEAP